MNKYLKESLLVCASAALLSIAILCGVITGSVDRLTTNAVQIENEAYKSLAYSVDLQTDARRVILIAGGTLNIARDTMRDQQKTVKAESQAILDTTRNVNAAVRHIDANSATAFNQLGVSLQGLTPVMAAATETLTKTGKTVDSLNAAVSGPVMGTLTNVQGATADVQTEVHRFVYPPPRKWYEKYIIDPAKIAGHLLTYSVK